MSKIEAIQQILIIAEESIRVLELHKNDNEITMQRYEKTIEKLKEIVKYYQAYISRLMESEQEIITFNGKKIELDELKIEIDNILTI